MRNLDCIKKTEAIMSIRTNRDIMFDSRLAAKAVKQYLQKCSMQCFSSNVKYTANTSSLFAIKAPLDDLVASEIKIKHKVAEHIILYESANDLAQIMDSDFVIYLDMENSVFKNSEVFDISSMISGICHNGDKARFMSMPKAHINREMLYYTKSIPRAFNMVYNMNMGSGIAAYMSDILENDCYRDACEIIDTAESLGVNDKVTFIFECHSRQCYDSINDLGQYAQGRCNLELIARAKIDNMLKDLQYTKNRSLKLDGIAIDHNNIKPLHVNSSFLSTHLLVL